MLPREPRRGQRGRTWMNEVPMTQRPRVNQSPGEKMIGYVTVTRPPGDSAKERSANASRPRPGPSLVTAAPARRVTAARAHMDERGSDDAEATRESVSRREDDRVRLGHEATLLLRVGKVRERAHHAGNYARIG